MEEVQCTDQQQESSDCITELELVCKPVQVNKFRFIQSMLVQMACGLWSYTAKKIRIMYSQKSNCATLVPISIFIHLWAIYIFLGSVQKLGLMSRGFLSGNIFFQFSVQNFCNVDSSFRPYLTTVSCIYFCYDKRTIYLMKHLYFGKVFAVLSHSMSETLCRTRFNLAIIVNSKEKKKIGVVSAKLVPQIWQIGEKRLYKASSFLIHCHVHQRWIDWR